MLGDSLVAEAVRQGVRVEDVTRFQVGVQTLVHQHFELIPETVAAVSKDCVVRPARADPLDLVVSHGA